MNAPSDSEVNIKIRNELEYFITFPSNFSENNKYGVVFCITGYGDNADSEYQFKKLHPYIYEEYNMLIVGVRYHNDLRVKQTMKVNKVVLSLFYNIDINQLNAIKDYNEMIEFLHNFLIANKI
ncbi:DUF2920 family protein [Clostridium sp. 'White wine YQ']|uniref:DUF2920 family protein n=1 Tax=Clostridium sp. 'White wine YQ' TaxID=3027474 RepID=UPI002366D1FF|nr:DUF2920 family protein [Clostridium sp. 'White wine YQ']MDD7794620.1 DUF2920 family protein [Clostridium sp. 'White wine YQ']